MSIHFSKTRLIPSINIGEYRPGIERPDDGGLYPLEEAGTYGPVPKSKHPGKWSQPKAYVPRSVYEYPALNII